MILDEKWLGGNSDENKVERMRMERRRMALKIFFFNSGKMI